jgi:MSHA biogenesis protein MshK
VFKFSQTFLLSIILLSIASHASAAKVDPTRPFGHKGPSTIIPINEQMVLESIIHGDGIHTVVISGKVLKTLDYIGEYQLTAVNDQSVILRSKTERLKLNVFKGSVVKQRVAK